MKKKSKKKNEIEDESEAFEKAVKDNLDCLKNGSVIQIFSNGWDAGVKYGSKKV